MKLAVILSLAALALAAAVTVARSIAGTRAELLWCPLCDGGDPEADCECPAGCGATDCRAYESGAYR